MRSRETQAICLAGVFFAALLCGCGGNNILVRTDIAPLTRRLKLPEGVQSVRWIAVSPVHDTGFIPPSADYQDVYAYIPLEPSQWVELENVVGQKGAPASIEIPRSIVDVLFPAGASGANQHRIEGPSFNPAKLVSDSKTEVFSAIRVNNALVVQMRVR